MKEHFVDGAHGILVILYLDVAGDHIHEGLLLVLMDLLLFPLIITGVDHFAESKIVDALFVPIGIS